MGDREVLEVGTGRRAGLPRRLRVLLLAVVVVLTASALLVDRELRDREERDVERCAVHVAAAVDAAGRRLQTTYEYVRPGLANTPSRVLRAGLLGLVSDAAAGAATRLAPARSSCAELSILPNHSHQRERRARCLTVLEEQRSALTAVARDGTEIQAWLDAPRRC